MLFEHRLFSPVHYYCKSKEKNDTRIYYFRDEPPVVTLFMIRR